MKLTKSCFAVILLSLLAVPAAFSQKKSDAGVGITRIEIQRREVAFGGQSFGSAGQYEMIYGKAYGEVDPKSPFNAGILNLDKALVNSRGHVEYNVDMVILKPVDINKGNGRLVYDVINRGHEKALADLNMSKFLSTGPQEVKDPATGLLMKRGYTMAWSGWQGEDSIEVAREGLLRARYPVAMSNGKPLVGLSREEITSVPAGPSFTRLLTYPAANLDKSAATLTVRQHEEDPRQPMPPSSWSYVDNKHVRITPAAGVDQDALYEFIYPATDSVIQGLAFLSIRDFVWFLRYAKTDSTGQPNPVYPAAPYKAVLGTGISQSGRLLKDMVYLDYNKDSSGRMIFDGILNVVSGSRKTNINTAFSQAGRFSRQHEDHLYAGDQFPFTYNTTKDPITGKTDGLQVKCTKSHTCPKTIQLDADTEIWQGRASLVLTTPDGKHIDLPENVRMFVPTGIPHNGRDLGEGPPVQGKPEERGICQLQRNPLEYRYYERALFIALDQWVTEGIAPPPSRYSNLKDGTLITMAEAEKIWPAIPGAPFSRTINKLRPKDTQEPPRYIGPEYPIFVERTNEDGNPIGGLVPPEVTVPIATYSGRNFRRAGYAEGDLCVLSGSYMPFAITKSERLAKHDPRPSLEERYKDQADFSAKRKQAAEAMVRDRLLLPEDVEIFTSVPLPTAASEADALAAH
ncbi:MAG TPA: alpha/beta hydrolase domain-containing protein [Terriglobales bacterium]|nr:alpha/beta hydrolase domain-containing protein [Terriglobales bacterium]